MNEFVVETWLRTYVERQEIANQALSQLRPDLLMLANAQGAEQIMNGFALREAYEAIPFTGIWLDSDGKEWDYFIHGLGCRLINRISKEQIEWDAPDVTAFDIEWFINWVEWYVEDIAPSDIAFIRLTMQKMIDREAIKQVTYKSGPKYQLVYKQSNL
ncbi:MAG: hypothetical protein J0M33_22040 [Anaerolineae bacterium]|nr:hypothetical protein [Anaerolineae bacterium]